jgi:oxygen-independent coproporphyrinogen-3 oxidase
VGVGPGAHGRITVDGKRIATSTTRNPENWLREVETVGTATTDDEIIAPIDQASEYLMMSLRLSEGSDMDRFYSLSGYRLDQQVIDRNQELGLVFASNKRLIATPRGRIILNTLLKDLLV